MVICNVEQYSDFTRTEITGRGPFEPSMTREYTPLLVFHETKSESHPFSSTPKANCLSKVVNINDKSRCSLPLYQCTSYICVPMLDVEI